MIKAQDPVLSSVAPRDTNKQWRLSCGLLAWEDLPEQLQDEEVRPYWESLAGKGKYLVLKRFLDIVLAIVVILITAPLLLTLMIAIRLESAGSPIFKQTRVTQYGRLFTIYKLRTMTVHSNEMTLANNLQNEVTKLGRYLRRLKIDEFPQAWNVLKGDMAFIGTRPELPRYVECYTPRMRATLLLRSGVTCEASIVYREEEYIRKDGVEPEDLYLQCILPEKMRIQINEILKISLLHELGVIIRTVFHINVRSS